MGSATLIAPPELSESPSGSLPPPSEKVYGPVQLGTNSKNTSLELIVVVQPGPVPEGVAIIVHPIGA